MSRAPQAGGPPATADRMRLDRLLCLQGLATRSDARRIIQRGRVHVDGVPASDAGAIIDAAAQTVTLDGVPIAYKRHRFVMLHKPAGILTAARDTRRQTVLDLLPPLYRACGCMPCGRLDIDTEGLLLLTNDGEAAHRLLSPKRHVDKVYFARVDGPLARADEEAFAAGLSLSDFTALPARLCVQASAPGMAEALVTVQEGKFHQIKRMFAARGRTVTYLKRLSIGPIALDDALAPGMFRELTDVEERALREAIGVPLPGMPACGPCP